MVPAPEFAKKRPSSVHSDTTKVSDSNSTGSLLSKVADSENFIRISFLDRTKIVKRPNTLTDCVTLAKREFNLDLLNSKVILSMEILGELIEIGEGGWDAVNGYAAIAISVGKPFKKTLDELTGLAVQDVTTFHPGKETITQLRARIAREQGISISKQKLLVFEGVQFDPNTPLSVYGITDRTKVLVGTKAVKEY